MSITLTDTLEARIRDKVQSGAYRTEAEVVDESLRLLEERDRRQEALRHDIQLGLEDIADGRSEPLDIEALISEFEEDLKIRQA